MDFSSFTAKVTEITGNIIVAIALHIPFLLHVLIGSPAIPPSLSLHTTSTTTASIVQNSTTTPTLNVPVTFPSLSKMDLIKHSFRNLPNGKTVSFVDSNVHSRNPVFNVLLDSAKVGEFAGYLVSDPFFSPTKSYLSFESMSVCGADCSTYTVNLVDVVNSKFIKVEAPNLPRSLSENTVIESYNWSSDGSGIDVTAYTVIGDENSETGYSRTTPKQIWHYDILTRKYVVATEASVTATSTKIITLGRVTNVTTVDHKIYIDIKSLETRYAQAGGIFHMEANNCIVNIGSTYDFTFTHYINSNADICIQAVPAKGDQF